MDFYKGVIPIIDGTPEALAYAMPTVLHGRPIGFGYVPRDFAVDPPEMFAPSDMPIIPASEYDARYDEQEEQKSSLEHLYLSGPGGAPAFENLDQNGHGYCWAYSTGHAVMLMRLLMNQPLVRLNPHSVAAIIKRGADEGGWCGLSARFLQKEGIASEEFWPRHSRSLSNDTPATRANMALHKVTEDWIDLARPAYDDDMTDHQVGSNLFTNVPVSSDHGWWAHSVCKIRRVRLEANSWGDLILNSWKGWGRYGLAVLRGAQARSDGAVALRVTGASAA